MKKIFFALMLAFAALFVLASCGGHTHDYTEKNTDAQYLATAANCQSAAKYYYSCTCGEVGTETFTSGDLGHKYVVKNTSSKCLAESATCGSAAKYYYSCSCGELGTETFEHGNALITHQTENGICTVCGLSECSAGLKFEINSNGLSYTVVDIGTCTSTDLVIGIHNNFNVTAIAPDVFSKTNITSVTISDKVTSIGEGAFERCEALESVRLGSALTSIGEDAFYYCSNLKSIVIPDSVTVISRGAFSNCTSLESVTIGSGVATIMESAFENCASIKSLIVPNNVNTIEDGAFRGCDSLESITVPFVEPHFGFIFGYSLGYTPFYHYQDLHNKYYTFYIPETLKSVTISETATQINFVAFFGCTNISSITVSEDNPSYKSLDGNLYTKDGKTLIQYAVGKQNTSFTVPDGVNRINHYAFRGSESLEEVIISADVTEIGFGAFENCENLQSVVFENLNNWSAGDIYLIAETAIQTPATAATFLKSTYVNHVWKRN